MWKAFEATWEGLYFAVMILRFQNRRPDVEALAAALYEGTGRGKWNDLAMDAKCAWRLRSMEVVRGLGSRGYRITGGRG